MKRWHGLAVLAVLVLAVTACTDDRLLWWEAQADEISDEVVRDFCVDRVEYCSDLAERLTAVVDELKGTLNGSTGATSERSITISWGENYYGESARSLPQPYRSICGHEDYYACLTLRYELIGDWRSQPYYVECLTDGIFFQRFVWDVNGSDQPIGCIFPYRLGPASTGTGTAQVVFGGDYSNILPSRD